MTDGDPAPTSRFDDLKPRIIVAVVAGIVAFGFEWAGGHPAAVFVAVVSALMLWELTNLVAPESDLQRLPRSLLIIFGAIAVFAMHFNGIGFLLIALIGAVAAFALNPGRLGPITLSGYAMIVCAAGGAIYLRDIPGGFPIILWIVICVIAADVGGYAFGRIIGGPKLLPSISPKKTWAGFLGGMALSLIVAAIYAVTFSGNLGTVLLLGVVIAIVSVAGDLAESSVKRKFGVKDSGVLLPGHGGLLDRLDGMAAVMILFLIMSFFTDLNVLLAENYLEKAAEGATM